MFSKGSHFRVIDRPRATFARLRGETPTIVMASRSNVKLFPSSPSANLPVPGVFRGLVQPFRRRFASRASDRDGPLSDLIRGRPARWRWISPAGSYIIAIVPGLGMKQWYIEFGCFSSSSSSRMAAGRPRHTRDGRGPMSRGERVATTHARRSVEF